jgi:hypothetical protein
LEGAVGHVWTFERIGEWRVATRPLRNCLKRDYFDAETQRKCRGIRSMNALHFMLRISAALRQERLLKQPLRLGSQC